MGIIILAYCKDVGLQTVPVMIVKGYLSQYFLQPEFYISLHVDSSWSIVFNFVHNTNKKSAMFLPPFWKKNWANAQESMPMVKGSESP